MKFPLCLLALLEVLHGIGAAVDQYEQDREDLEEFAREAERLFHALPGWDETLEMSGVPWSPRKRARLDDGEVWISEEEREGSGEGYDPDGEGSGQVTTVPEIDYVVHISSEETSGSVHRSYVERGSSAGESSGSRTFVRTAHRTPFTIDDQGSFESGEPDGCLRDRLYITSIFRECIYEQMETDPERDTATSQEPQANSVTRFLKNCRKTPQLRECVKKTILEKMAHCLDEGMNETIANVEEVTSGIIRFICNKEADRIATFITDGSFKCLQSNSGRIITCFGTDLATHVLTSLFDLPSLRLTVTKCLQLRLAETCVNRELTSCKNRALVNIAAVIFNIAQEMASCDIPRLAAQVLPEHEEPGTSEADGHDARVQDNMSPTTASHAELSTTEQTLPTTPHAHNESSSTANTTSWSCHFEITTVLLICTLVFGSVLSMQAVRRLLKVKTQSQRPQSVK